MRLGEERARRYHWLLILGAGVCVAAFIGLFEPSPWPALCLLAYGPLLRVTWVVQHSRVITSYSIHYTKLYDSQFPYPRDLSTR